MIIALLAWLASLLWETVEDEEEEETEEEPEEEEKEPEEDIKNPRIKELSAEAKKWRLKFRAAQKRIGELEESSATGEREVLRASRLETAFLREVLTSEEPLEVESAWDLLNARGFVDTVKVGDDGAVEGMAEAMSRLLEATPGCRTSCSRRRSRNAPTRTSPASGRLASGRIRVPR